MPHNLLAKASAKSRGLYLMDPEALSLWQKKQSKAERAWVAATGFTGRPGSLCFLPSGAHAPGDLLAGWDPESDLACGAQLASVLPEGSYRLAAIPAGAKVQQLAFGWGLASYRFDRYKKAEKPRARLVCPNGVELAAATNLLDAVFLVRDLINTPANDMGPAELGAAARRLAKRHGAKVKVTVGEALLRANYPAIHAVGRASSQAPRLIDMTWGRGGPKVTLVGKGVCFDSGGLDHQDTGRRHEVLMKKDMGGAAHVLGLAAAIMGAGLPLRLRVLVPAVENAVSGNAMRPSDIIATRKGLTVEVGNTDAEGRLVLSDALSEACREKPDLLIDFATLTGAARVALGTELPALFCNDEDLAAQLLTRSGQEEDPLWRMPLHQPYRRLLDSKVADTNNISRGGYGGAITAALFLERFVTPGVSWAHIDLMAWNLGSRPGRPEGGEAMGLRAVFSTIAALAARTSRRS